MSGTDEEEGGQGLPPAIGTWRRAYALVLAVLAADVFLLWLMGHVFG